MSLPQLLARVLLQGTQILGKAFLEAGRQAGRNLRATPEGAAAAASQGGAGGAAGANKGDELTRTHKMTVEEARMILNFKPEEGEELEGMRERVEKAYTHLFSVNAPPAPKGKTGGGSGSFYMQSKVVRAKQRIEAEWEQLAKNVREGAEEAEAASGSGKGGAADQTQPPPPPPPPAS